MSEQVLFEGRVDVTTNQAQNNVQALQGKLDALDKNAVTGANGIKTLNSTIDKGAQALGGLQAGGQAVAQLMRGNFVGAFAAGSNAVKALWVAFSANPFAAIVTAVAGFAMYVFKYFDDIKKKSAEAKKNVQTFEEEFAEFEKNRKAFEERDTNPVAVANRLAETATENTASVSVKFAKDNLATKVEGSNIERDNFKSWLAVGGTKENYERKAQLETAMAEEETAREVLSIWEEKLKDIHKTQKELREKNATEATATANQLAEDEKGRIKDVEAVRTESTATPVPSESDTKDNRAISAEARYAYDKLSATDKLKATNKALGNISATASKEGWTEESRLKRIELLRQRDSLKESLSKGATVEGNEDETAKPKGQSRFKLGGNYREMYDARIRDRQERSGMSKLTYDRQSKDWLTKEQLQDRKDGKDSKKTRVDDAILSTDKNIEKIAKVLAG